MLDGHLFLAHSPCVTVCLLGTTGAFVAQRKGMVVRKQICISNKKQNKRLNRERIL